MIYTRLIWSDLWRQSAYEYLHIALIQKICSWDFLISIIFFHTFRHYLQPPWKRFNYLGIKHAYSIANKVFEQFWGWITWHMFILSIFFLKCHFCIRISIPGYFECLKWTKKLCWRFFYFVKLIDFLYLIMLYINAGSCKQINEK